MLTHHPSERARAAVRGLVTDSAGQPVAGAAVMVTGRNKDVLTTEAGEFWRILVPGKYRLRAVKDDKESEEVEVEVREEDEEGPTVNLSLTKTSLTTTTPFTPTQTGEAETDYLELRDPLGLVCLKFSWQSLVTFC